MKLFAALFVLYALFIAAFITPFVLEIVAVSRAIQP